VADQIDKFQLRVGRRECEEACHRALRSVDWTVLASDLFEGPLAMPGSEQEAALGFLDRVTRGRFRRYVTRSGRAPAGPPGAGVEICAVWSARVVVRVSLQDRGLAATDLTISGSGLPGTTDAMVRSAIGELRRSIEIQSGTTTPYLPPA